MSSKIGPKSLGFLRSRSEGELGRAELSLCEKGIHPAGVEQGGVGTPEVFIQT